MITNKEGSADVLHHRAGDAAALEYQSLSPLAALALALGLASPAALASPLLLVIPAAAVGVALLALARIRTSDGALTGAALARCGLAIALACAVAPLVRDPVRDALMRRQMADVAHAWLNLLAEGSLNDAQGLMSGQAISSLGPAPPKPGEEPPKPEVVETVILEKLRSDKLVRKLAGWKTPLTLTARSATGPVFESGRTLASGEYDVHRAGGGESCRLELNFVRAPFYEAEGRPWRIERWTLIEAPAGGAAGENPT